MGRWLSTAWRRGRQEISIAIAPAQVEREHVLAAARTGDQYAAVGAALLCLRDAPHDDEIRAIAFQAFDALGLWTAATRLLQCCECGPELRAKLRTSGRAGAERLAWGTFDAQFRANLLPFEERTGLGRELEQVWTASRVKLDLTRDARGTFQVLSRMPECPGWLPALAPHPDWAPEENLRRAWHLTLVRPVALCGLGLGYAARSMIAASRDTHLGYAPPVHVVEPSLLAWAVVLHLHDWREMWAERRVCLHAGKNALASLAGALADPERQHPLVYGGGPTWPDTPADLHDEVRRVVACSEQERATQLRARYETLCEELAGRDAGWWARRFENAGQSEPPLTVLGIVSRFTTVLQYSMRELLAAFERLGHRVHLLTEADCHANLPSIRVLQELERVRPDLIAIIDHLQCERATLFPPQIPGVCWVQDRLPHLFDRAAAGMIQPLEFVIGHNVPELVVDFGYPADRVMPCAIPTDPYSLLDADETEDNLAPYRCDVMYATHAPAHRTPEEARAALRANCDPGAAGLVDGVCAAIKSRLRDAWPRASYSVEAEFKRQERKSGLTFRSEQDRAGLVFNLRSILDQCLRQEAIRAAIRWAEATGGRFHLYGRGWERFPEFAPYHRGTLEPGRPLGRAFRAAKISLHAGVNSALHQRVLDGLCAGGFVLLPGCTTESYADVIEAVYRWVVRNRPALPVTVRPADLEAPLAGRFREMLAAEHDAPPPGITVTAKWVIHARSVWDLQGQHMASRLWPCYERVVFRGADELTERIEHFVRNDEERRELAAQMRAAVVQHFTYDRLAARTLAFMQNSLAGKHDGLAVSR
jgi:hypothetical protein